jgi:hypothetical protein
VNYKGQERVLTVGRWPWKLAAGKKRVTPYLPNVVCRKIDGGGIDRLDM